ncbi:hypothetical protein HPB52_000646 [Rhipicephalus sanguineus]|uniref:Uncharacterized protein n=1 Tax=Rhipicephalus sanguineus TaxID=34632 RepID=A0A9D4SS66_RHISA|nr:hypothetical protein HPB52_000646 [Rhipicephalus sanguineus]
MKLDALWKMVKSGKVHRASRRQRGLPPEAPEQPTDTVTMTSPQAVMEVPTNNIEWIREIVRSVVREEIQKLYGPRQPEVGSIASVIRDEVQQVLHNRHYQLMPTNVEPAPVSTDIRSRTYAEALRMPVSSLPVASPAVPIQMMPPNIPFDTAYELAITAETAAKQQEVTRSNVQETEFQLKLTVKVEMEASKKKGKMQQRCFGGLEPLQDGVADTRILCASAASEKGIQEKHAE